MSNLRADAAFDIEIFPNVFWVPANSLGHSKYTADEIKSIVLSNPFEKRQRINNLYEALQLYQASKFKGIIDNVRIVEEDTAIIWLFHKNGFDAVRTNEGCCAADSNWLTYVLDGVYDEIGCFGFCQPDGNGHITNYIKHENWYYFLDMMMQRYDSAQNIGIENGNLNDYNKNPASGYIHRAKSFDDYIKYCLGKFDTSPSLFYRTTQPECICIGSEYYWQADEEKKLYNLMQKSNKFLFYINSAEILWSENDCVYEFKNTKAIEPDWSSIKSFDFGTLGQELK